MTEIQPSTLLSSAFDKFEVDQRLTVLHIGPALPETVDFFSRFRSKLHFVDIFSELPIVADEITGPSLRVQFDKLLHFPAATRIDLCLFWDVFNFLDGDAVVAFLDVLRPYLSPGCLAHGFAVYNLKSPQVNQFYGIEDIDKLNVRTRAERLPAYRPHAQNKLKDLLNSFNFDRSVLLADSRLELLLSLKA
jgi:hypothetical protein